MDIYTRDEVYTSTLEYFKGDTLATEVWINKYCLKDSDGNLYEKTPDDMHRRIASELARIENKYPNPLSEELIYNKIKNFTHIVPQGSPMSGIGNDFQVTSIGNCLQGDTKVLTREGYKLIKDLANTSPKIMTKGGGWVTAPFKNYGKQVLYKISLSKGKTSTKNIYCTEKHDWYIKRPTNKTKLIKISTLDLKVGDKLHNQYGKGYKSTKPSPFGVAHGITFGDGNTDKNEDFANSIVLCGDSQALSKYFINDEISNNKDLCEGGSSRYGSLPNYYRELPNILENRSYLYGWLSGYFAVDGNIDRNGSIALHSAIKNNISFIQDVCGILGIGCGEIQQQTVISNLTNKPHTMYKCFIHSNHLTEDFFILEKHKNRFKITTKSPNKWEVTGIFETNLVEEVYCAEVPDTNSFVIDNNILSGNCFVIGSDSDSYGGVMRTDEEQIQLMKRRGGVGHDLSHIRPINSKVNNSALTSTGVVPFMERYSNSTREVAQCLIYDTDILTKNGLVEIQNIKSGDLVWTRKGWISVKETLKNGVKKTFKVKTKRGYEITSTKEHIYLDSNNDEKKLKDFNIGDNIVLLTGNKTYSDEIKLKKSEYVSNQPNWINNLNKIKLPQKLNSNLSYLLGYSYGDGHFSYNNKNKAETFNLSININDADILKKLKTIIKTEFNIEPKINKGSGNVNVIKIHSVVLCDWLNINSIKKEYSENIAIPNKILKSNSNIQMSFFSGYFDADGCAHKNGKNIRATSISSKFIKTLQKILLSNGIVSNVQEFQSNKKNKKREYRLNIQGNYSQTKLIELSNSIKINKISRPSKIDKILTPYNYKDLKVKNIRKKYSYIPNGSNRKISLSSLNRFNNETNKDIVLSFMDEIVSVIEYGNYETYDLKLIDEHLFWANGFYAHNSGRRGALMLSMDIKHPDVESFIDAKLEKNKVTGANISIKLSDEFMRTALNDTSFKQQFPVDSAFPKIVKETKAKPIWDKIVRNAWKCIPYESELFVYENNIHKKIKIGDLYSNRNSNNYEILSINLNNKKIERKKITDFQKYKNDKNIYQLTTKSKKNITATEDHIVYSLESKGTIKSSPISETAVGDYLVVSNKNRLEDSAKEYIDLLTNYSDDKNAFIWGDFISNLLSTEKIKKRFGKYSNGEYKINSFVRRKKIPLSALDIELSSYKKEILASKPTLYYRGTKIDSIFEIDNDLMLFLGLFYAEGSIHNTSIRLSINTNELDSYIPLCDSISKKFSCNYNKEIDGNSTTISFNSSYLISIFNILKITKTKEIFNSLFSYNQTLVGKFLCGIFSGDGTIDKSGNISLTQNRAYIIKDIQQLLLFFGIHSVLDNYSNIEKIIKGKKVKNNSISYRLSIYKQYNKLYNLNINFLLKEKKERLNSSLTSKVKEFFGIPITDKKVFNKLRISGREVVSKHVLNTNVRVYNHKLSNEDKDYLNNIVNDDIHYEKIISVEKLDVKEEYVYDITVKDNHTFLLANGLPISNSAEPGVFFWDKVLKESIPSCYGEGWIETSSNPCGELVLPPYDSCRLLAINLFGYVINPFTKKSSFNWEAFKEDAILAERMMDDIIDLELEKIDKILAKLDSDPESASIKATEIQLWLNIKDKAEQGRRTGLGITAEGDMLAALGITYGTDEATDFSEEVHKVLKIEAYRSSIIMAKERGTFPIYSSDKEVNNPFIMRLKSEDGALYKEMLTYGRRNIALLTIAPTGSVSLMTQTTSGIEPAFLISYMRRKKVNPQDKNARIDFTDELGDTWTEYPVFHHNFKLWLRVNGWDVNNVIETYSKEEIQSLIEKSPYHNATSNDVNWVKKVEMQGKIQKHVDHSISVTVNLPKDTTEEVVSKVYETGWRSGCKGITVYRDGSRSGVLVTEEDKKQETVKAIFDDNHAPKRPKRLKAEIIRFQNNHEKWVGVVGLLEGRPYEIFTGKLENGLSNLPMAIKECEIVKKRHESGNSHYDMEYTIGDTLYTYNLSESFNPEYWNYAKLISSVLRHGMPILYVQNLIQSLDLNDAHLNTWKNGISRVIKKYIQDGEQGNGECPSCGSGDLQYIEGCLTCSSCGSSKCN